MSGFFNNRRGLTMFAILAGFWILYQLGGYLDTLLGPISLSLVTPLAGGLVIIGLSMWQFARSRAILHSTPLTPELPYGHFDFLTKLPNRVLLQDRLGSLSARARRDGAKIALHLVDLDHFKRINDELGHCAGDNLLVLVANRLLDTCRDIDTVARLGGDEFVILQLVESSAEAQALGERVIKAVSRPFVMPRGEVIIGCSIGVVTTTGFSLEMDSLVEAADRALYFSKKEGGNAINFVAGHANETASETRVAPASVQLTPEKV
jgi:diguanylate cyclase (GGDEF)-like protein